MSEATPTEELDADFDPEEDAPLRAAEPIVYFGTDFDVHGLVRRLNSGDILVPSFDPSEPTGSALAGFQRKFVWKPGQMERFIESLLLGFPVPGIFLVQQPNKALLVLDGQQRLRTLQAFYAGKFALSEVVDRLKGKTYGQLDDEERRALDNTFIHATIMKYDASERGASSIYSIFERLNAGGTNLHPHEIRVALHNGPLVNLIRDLNAVAAWRSLYGKPNARLKDQELILRWIALTVASSEYQRPLKSFLNTFLFKHRDMQDLSKDVLLTKFTAVCDAVNSGIGKAAFRASGAINSALVDAVLVAVGRRLDRGPISDPKELKVAFDVLISNQTFLDSIARATADEDRVKARLDLATEAFEGV
jgi:hypothetical protein